MESGRHPPTPRKIRRLRGEGKVYKSQYLTQCFAVLAAISTATYTLPLSWVELAFLIDYLITTGPESLAESLQLGALVAVRAILPPLAAAVIAGFLTEAIQVGWLLKSFPWPDLGRLNPIPGVRRIGGAWKGLVINSSRLTCLLVVLSFSLRDLFLMWSEGGGWFEPADFRFQLIKSASLMGVVMLLFAVHDFILQRRRWFREAAMTADELKRERKEDDGDPVLRGHRSQIHQEILSLDIVKRIRSSKVLIVERIKQDKT